MNYVVAGHGSFHVDQSLVRPGMERVGIAPGTRIHAFTDLRNKVLYGPDQDLWGQLHPAADFDSSLECIPNLALSSLRGPTGFEDFLCRAMPGFIVVQPGVDDYPDPVVLCTGTPKPARPRPSRPRRENCTSVTESSPTARATCTGWRARPSCPARRTGRTRVPECGRINEPGQPDEREPLRNGIRPGRLRAPHRPRPR